MALLGATTLQLLATAFLDELPRRSRDAVERLAAVVPQVFVDARSTLARKAHG
jgi:hypothetical protein